MVTPTFAEFSKAYALSEAERKLCGCILQGRCTKDIATNLQQHPGSVKNAMNRIYSKLGIKGERAGKRLSLVLFINRWLLDEKKRRIRERMSA